MPAAGFSLFCFCLVAVQKLDLAALGGSCVLLLSVPDESTQDMGPMETRLEGWQIRRLLSLMFSLTRRRMKTLRVPYSRSRRRLERRRLARESPLPDSAYFALVLFVVRSLIWRPWVVLVFCCFLLCSRKARKTWANGNPIGRLENSVTSL